MKKLELPSSPSTPQRQATRGGVGMLGLSPQVLGMLGLSPHSPLATALQGGIAAICGSPSKAATPVAA